MRAETTSWATSCSLRSRADPPLQCVNSPGGPALVARDQEENARCDDERDHGL